MTASPSTTTSTTRPSGSDIDPARRWYILLTVVIGTFMILLDSTIVNVAVPSIQSSLQASYENIEWIVGGYALSYGLLLIPAGRLGDRFGHKTLFITGLVGFTIFSALCGTARSASMLMLWRVLQGAMAGVMNPQITAIIQITFPPSIRGKAFGIYSAIIGIATATGPLVGGVLISAKIAGLEWEPIFLINIPIGILGLILASRTLEQTYGRAGSLDIAGIAIVSAAVLALTVPLVEGRVLGWPAWTFLSIGASFILFAVFAVWERRRLQVGKSVLVNVGLFRNRSFSAGMGIALAYFGGFTAIFFITSLLIQNGLGYSALYSGLTVIPFSAGSLISSSQSDKFAKWLGRRCLFLGTALVMVGIGGLVVVLERRGVSVTAWNLAPWFFSAGFGSGLIIAPNVTLTLSGVPGHEAGSASGVLSATQRLGQAIGICLVGIMMFGALSTQAPSSVAAVTDDLRANLIAAHMPEDQIDTAIATFTRCFEEQADSADPTETPAGCPEQDTSATDPVSVAFRNAAETALGKSFIIGAQRALITSWVLVAITFLLVFLLPKRIAEGRH
ncbi:MAG TPA: MFS transporter [Thermomicrobiales bacterium]|nr:MFS transporter [Thermomicrobiales bacterium]